MRPAAISVRATLLALVVAATAVPAAIAQTVPDADPATRSRVRVGPLWINPVLNLKNLGVDSNVFNDPANAKQDFTATVTPMTDVFVRSGLFRADMRIGADLVYFRQYRSERSSNASLESLFSYAGGRFTPYAGADYTSTRERPGFEVDTRALHTMTRVRLGTDVKVGARSLFGLEASRRETAFADAASFRGVRLGEELNRTESLARITFKNAITPLTRVLTSVEVQADRFAGDDTRDADSYRVSAGLELEPVALVGGTATFGYRRLQFLDRQVEGIGGFVTSVNLTYTLSSFTRLGVQTSRDTQYSYDPERPYYIQTGIGGTLTQGIVGSWDVQLSGSRQTLGYRDALGRPTIEAGTDRVLQYGLSVGYRIGRDSRLALTAGRVERRSGDPLRRYSGNQIGTSITYGS
jgi:putative beta-barrel porin BBP2